MSGADEVRIERVDGLVVVRQGPTELVTFPEAIAMEVAEALLRECGYEVQGEMMCPTCLGDMPMASCERDDGSCITCGGVDEVLVFEIVVNDR